MDDVKLPILPANKRSGSSSGTESSLTRRQAVRRLVGALASAAASTAWASLHPVYRHWDNPEALIQAATRSSAGEWTPEFLNSEQNSLLIAIAERMLPGSTQAQVNRMIDLLLTIDNSSNRSNFLSSLRAIDEVGQHRYQQSFVSLSPAEQDEVLAVCSNANPTPSDFVVLDPDDPIPSTIPVTSRDHFENLKGWIVGTYYATEQGMRELGWTEDFYFDQVPACEHEDKHTAGSGAEAEPGPAASL